MKRFLQTLAIMLGLCAGAVHAQGSGKVEVQWLGQAAFRTTSPGIEVTAHDFRKAIEVAATRIFVPGPGG
jgi:hypothetical protein